MDSDVTKLGYYCCCICCGEDNEFLGPTPASDRCRNMRAEHHVNPEIGLYSPYTQYRVKNISFWTCAIDYRDPATGCPILAIFRVCEHILIEKWVAFAWKMQESLFAFVSDILFGFPF